MSAAPLRPSLLKQREFCRGYSPLYFALYDALLRAVDAADPGPARPFVRFAEWLWPQRTWTYAMEPSLVVGAAVHALVLEGAPEAHALRRFYPSTGGAFRPEDAPALEAALWQLFEAAPPALYTLAKTLFIQTNEVSRGIAWLLPALWLTRSRQMPIQLVDLGCSAGLNLVAELNAFDWTFDDARVRRGDGPAIVQRIEGLTAEALQPARRLEVTARVGVDRAPRDVRDGRDRLLVRACLFPDQLERIARFDRAVELFRAQPTVSLLREDAVPGVRAALEQPADVPSLVLVYNTVATSYLPLEGYAQLEAAIAAGFAGLRRATALWLEFEPTRARPEGPLELWARRLEGGRLQAVLLGGSEPHPRHFRASGDWDALLPTAGTGTRR